MFENIKYLLLTLTKCSDNIPGKNAVIKAIQTYISLLICAFTFGFDEVENCIRKGFYIFSVLGIFFVICF